MFEPVGWEAEARIEQRLEDLAESVARVSGTAGARIELGGRWFGYGYELPGREFERVPLLHDGMEVGSLRLVDGGTGSARPNGHGAALSALARVIVQTHERERAYSELLAIAERARRADVILRLVSEAVSCADALTSLLGELCRHHGATVGRIWRLLLPEGEMQEVSRFNVASVAANSYYQGAAPAVHSGNSMTALAIWRNEPQVAVYSRIERPERFVLMPSAMEAGLRSQVSFPIWVQEERFGISLAFTTERGDLAAIVADIASLADTIRPLLFRKVSEERIRFMALHDDLTRLANRAMFNSALEHAVAVAARRDEGLTLLYLDLDGFKLINDTRGHQAGDRLLVRVAERLRESVREGDIVARIGGDEFAIIQPGEGQAYAAVRLAQRLLDHLREPHDVGGQRVVVGASIGIAQYPAGGTSPDELLRNADTALYTAKHSGRNGYRMFDSSLGAEQRSRDLIERELRDAIENGALMLAYQPIVETVSLRVRGLEALLRWVHPVQGPLAPEVFVPVAEASGLIVPLGAWALETACAEAATWPDDLCLSVNFSPLQFRQPDLAEKIGAVLARTGLAGSRLDLEVTEGLLLDGSDSVLTTMRDLKALGIRMTLDDFGTAYASLSYLRRFPFDRLKVDRSFMRGIVEDENTLAIMQAILSLSERLGVEVVAEGVETGAQLEVLRELGCDLVQGFFTGAPAFPGR